MELALIRRIADIINERRTWINAELSPKQTPYLIPLDGTISVCYSCSLNLQVIEARNGYKKNQKWIIPEVVLFTPSKWLYPECDGLYTQFDAATDYRTVMPQFRNYDANAQLLALIRRFAEEKDASPAQISLAWMLRTMPLRFNSPMRSLLR